MSKLKAQNYNSKLKTNLRYRAYQFSLLVIKLREELFKRICWIIIDQLLRAAASIGDNLIEAKLFLKKILFSSANTTGSTRWMKRETNSPKAEPRIPRVLPVVAY